MGDQEFSAASNTGKKNSVVVKVGMVGDSQIGKTSLMVKYVEGTFDEDYIQTLGVNFMEKTISIRGTEITFSIWDLGGQREFVNMLPLVCNDAVAVLFMFDLSRKSTLNSVKEWYRQARGFNKTAIPFLIGTKYDIFATSPPEDQEEVTKQARKFAAAMKAPLIFCSTSHSINVQKIFKIVISKAFDLSRKSTLNSVKEWYRQARGFNKTAIPFLIGTKYDIFATTPIEDQEEVTKQARKFAAAMKAPLIFCSTSHSINVQKIFKIVISKAFDLNCTIDKIIGTGEPILEY